MAKEQPKLEPARKTDTTRLTVVITEESHGNVFSVETEVVSVETGAKLILRPSHIIGQLMEAAIFLSNHHYTMLHDELMATKR